MSDQLVVHIIWRSWTILAVNRSLSQASSPKVTLKVFSTSSFTTSEKYLLMMRSSSSSSSHSLLSMAPQPSNSYTVLRTHSLWMAAIAAKTFSVVILRWVPLNSRAQSRSLAQKGWRSWWWARSERACCGLRRMRLQGRTSWFSSSEGEVVLWVMLRMQARKASSRLKSKSYRMRQASQRGLCWPLSTAMSCSLWGFASSRQATMISLITSSRFLQISHSCSNCSSESPIARLATHFPTREGRLSSLAWPCATSLRTAEMAEGSARAAMRSTISWQVTPSLMQVLSKQSCVWVGASCSRIALFSPRFSRCSRNSMMRQPDQSWAESLRDKYASRLLTRCRGTVLPSSAMASPSSEEKEQKPLMRAMSMPILSANFLDMPLRKARQSALNPSCFFTSLFRTVTARMASMEFAGLFWTAPARTALTCFSFWARSSVKEQSTRSALSRQSWGMARRVTGRLQALRKWATLLARAVGFASTSCTYCCSIFLHFLPCFSLYIISCKKKTALLRKLASPSSSTSAMYWSEQAAQRRHCCWLRKVLVRQRQTASSLLSLASLPKRVRKSSSSWQRAISMGSVSPSCSSSQRSLLALLLHPRLRQLMYYSMRARPVPSTPCSSSFEQGTWQSPKRRVRILRLNFMARTDCRIFCEIQAMVGSMCSVTQFSMLSGSVSFRIAKDLQQQQRISSCASASGTHGDPTTRPRMCLANSPTRSSASRIRFSRKQPKREDWFSTSRSRVCSYCATHSWKPSTLWILCRKEKSSSTAFWLKAESVLSSSLASRFARNCLVSCFSSGVTSALEKTSVGQMLMTSMRTGTCGWSRLSKVWLRFCELAKRNCLTSAQPLARRCGFARRDWQKATAGSVVESIP